MTPGGSCTDTGLQYLGHSEWWMWYRRYTHH